MTQREKTAGAVALEHALTELRERYKHHAQVEAEVVELRSEVAALKSQIARLTEKNLEIKP